MPVELKQWYVDTSKLEKGARAVMISLWSEGDVLNFSLAFWFWGFNICRCTPLDRSMRL